MVFAGNLLWFVVCLQILNFSGHNVVQASLSGKGLEAVMSLVAEKMHFLCVCCCCFLDAESKKGSVLLQGLADWVLCG